MDLVNLGVETRAIVLPTSPSLLSLGKRCMNEGYDFEWRQGRKPVLTTPNGRRVALEVDKFCPVLPVGLGGAERSVPASVNVENAPVAQGNLHEPGKKTQEPLPPEHYLTHMPKDSRCEICMKCRTLRKQCRRKSKKSEGELMHKVPENLVI